jgi:hypothetical protein
LDIVADLAILFKVMKKPMLPVEDNGSGKQINGATPKHRRCANTSFAEYY